MPGPPARPDRCAWYFHSLLGAGASSVRRPAFESVHALIRSCVGSSDLHRLSSRAALPAYFGRIAMSSLGGAASGAQQQAAGAADGGHWWGVAADARMGDAGARRAWGFRSCRIALVPDPAVEQRRSRRQRLLRRRPSRRRRRPRRQRARRVKGRRRPRSTPLARERNREPGARRRSIAEAACGALRHHPAVSSRHMVSQGGLVAKVLYKNVVGRGLERRLAMFHRGSDKVLVCMQGGVGKQILSTANG